MSDEQDVGLEFGELQDDLESTSYPLSNAELLNKYGSREIGTESGSKTLDEILSPLEDEEYADAHEVHQSVLTMVGKSAEGRVNYSDRGGTQQDEDEQESL